MIGQLLMPWTLQRSPRTWLAALRSLSCGISLHDPVTPDPHPAPQSLERRRAIRAISSNPSRDLRVSLGKEWSYITHYCFVADGRVHHNMTVYPGSLLLVLVLVQEILRKPCRLTNLCFNDDFFRKVRICYDRSPYAISASEGTVFYIYVWNKLRVPHQQL